MEVIRGIDLSLYPGELAVLMGPSGSGKSTLLNILGLLDQSTEGDLFIHGRRIEGMSDRDRSRIRGREIGFVFQAFHLIPSLTVIQNVLVPSDLAHVSRKTSVPRAHHLLERVGLIHRIMHFPSELSGGEMQRVAIARSLINEPSILLCDEPTGSLDSSSGEQIMNLIRSLTKEGDRAVLMVTHDPRWGDLADKHFEMCDGRIESHPMRRCNHDSTLRAA
jgi:putative ABC transport system ATP-binding protein